MLTSVCNIVGRETAVVRSTGGTLLSWSGHCHRSGVEKVGKGGVDLHDDDDNLVLSKNGKVVGRLNVIRRHRVL